MGGHGIVLLLAVVGLVSGARPQRPHRVDMQPALTAAVGAFTNSTGGEASFALVESQQDGATGCSQNGFTSETKEFRTCMLVVAQVVCKEPSGKNKLQVSGQYICGRNEVSTDLKYFKACRVASSYRMHYLI
jgi:hypothetical protein